MPQIAPCYSDFFYDPLTEDVEELLARFQQTDSVRYQDFSAIWRDMSFSDVFLGIWHVSELKRFNRVALATAMKYFLPPYSYQIRVGGLYLMFGFYHSQLSTPPVQIRLTLRDWATVQTFLKSSLDSGHHDVLYIYLKLVAAKAFNYVAMPHFLSFQKQRNPKKDLVCADFLGRTTAVQEIVSSDILLELSDIESRYHQLKEATAGVRSSVDLAQPDLSSRLKDVASNFIVWQRKTFGQSHKDEDYEDDKKQDEKQNETSSSRAKLLSSIKLKSFKTVQKASKSRRHRAAQALDSCSSGPELDPVPRRKRPLSLRARTWKSLQLTEREPKTKTWLLSETQEKPPTRRIRATR
ncbi:snRNA-activating protein complex subunit 1-like [Antennarius striatus]|uniref:snRNA-activating protein complex subunit 1-like n=1 Tax=Antennarius striatus TaxID=241820 RepID=UPI0035B1579B